MKNFLILLFVSLLIPGIAANTKKNISSKITDVVVYRQFAKITATGNTTVQPGTTEIVFDNISTYINPQSLQVAIKGDMTLLSATYNINYLNESGKPVRNMILTDSLEWIGDELAWNTEQQNVYAGEMGLIEANKSLINEKNNFTALEVANLANLYRTRMMELKEKIITLTKKRRELAQIKISLENQLSEWSANLNKANGQIVLTVSSETGTTGIIRCSYIISNAGWTPQYDLRSDGWNKPVQLGYKANIYQNSGYDWNDVNLTISTGNPSKNNNRPILNPAYVNFVVAGGRGGATYGWTGVSSNIATIAMEKSEEYERKEDKVQDEKAFKDATKVESVLNANFMNVEYDLKIKQDIPTDGKEHMVAIDQFDLPAIYQYHAVPKLDPAAFLLAKVVDYGKYNLLPGTANIFFEGAYIGQSYIDPTLASDTMLLSLGKDEQITVKRIKLTEFSKTKLIATNKSETFAYETTIKNNKSTDINIEVLDQVPISKNDDIKVEIEEMSGAEYLADYGKLSWKINIPANSTKKIRIIYTIKYPKDQQIEETSY